MRSLTQPRIRSLWIAALGAGVIVALVALHGRADAPEGRYVISAGTVRDTETGLVWQQDDQMMQALPANIDSYCASLPLTGSGWRAPTLKELQTLVDRGKTRPAIDTTAFPTTQSTLYWTGSATTSPTEHWAVNFSEGFSLRWANDRGFLVRCVR